MARKRMISPEIWESEQAMSLDAECFKLFMYLISHADDEGRLAVSYPMIASRCFPMQNVTAEKVKKMMSHMVSIQLVFLYGDNGKMYLCHPNWLTYQKINHATNSRLPTPVLPDGYGSTPVDIPPNIIKVSISKDNICREESRLITTVVKYLNEKAGTKFKPDSKNAKKFIHDRLKEGHELEDFQKAIVWCISEWKDDEKMDAYIRPETIFGTKMDSYTQNWGRKRERLDNGG